MRNVTGSFRRGLTVGIILTLFTAIIPAASKFEWNALAGPVPVTPRDTGESSLSNATRDSQVALFEYNHWLAQIQTIEPFGYIASKRQPIRSLSDDSQGFGISATRQSPTPCTVSKY